MKALLVNPKTPITFWNFERALKIINKKSSEPPLGLLTIAALLPASWSLKLIDMNVTELLENDIKWADFVFLSGMNVQASSFRSVIKKCNLLGTKVVAGGPLATIEHNDFPGVDHYVLNEAEITLPEFLKDLKEGNPKKIYSSSDFPDIKMSPMPKWELLDIKKYATMTMQYSRGCPYDCEFCSITMLNGRTPRTKSKDQFLSELDRLYSLGWRGSVFIVDDNFIGNKVKLKNEIMPALIEWSNKYDHPFSFLTEATINIADDEDLCEMLIKAGFDSLFIGIETPNSSSLDECGKKQNLKRDLVQSVHRLQSKGFIVSGGFIVGFDNDTPAVFDDQINFIKESRITSAMVGILNAPIGTKLYKRLRKEDRLLKSFTGNNMDTSINFIPKMNYNELMRGYKKILKAVYSDKEYYARIKSFIKNYKMPEISRNLPTFDQIKTFIKLIWKLGFVDRGKAYFWDLLFYSLIKYPKKFIIAMTLAVYGFHFRHLAKTI